MNKLTPAKRCQVLALLCEGMSMRAITRVADVSMNAVVKLLEDAGEACLDLHNEEVRGVHAERVQCDEVWSFCYAKAKNVQKAKAAPEVAGDVWTWTAIDADTKLIISFLVNDRSALSAEFLVRDLAERVVNRMQLTTDSHKAYLSAVRREFQGEIDYAQLVKVYDKGGMNQSHAEARYSPPACTGIKKNKISGNPDPAHISTSYVERSNLSLRMHNRRFTRLTNAFSKRFVSHVRMVALYTMFYNFIRIHKTLRVTPAMQANITDRVWGFEDIVERMDRDGPMPGPRGPYKKRAA
jgi:IS1 family transposase